MSRHNVHCHNCVCFINYRDTPTQTTDERSSAAGPTGLKRKVLQAAEGKVGRIKM